MKQLDALNWGDLDTPIELCILPFKRVEMEIRFGIHFYTYLEKGLGEFCISEVEISGMQFILASPADSTGLTEYKLDAIVVFMSCRSSQAAQSLQVVLTEFRLTKKELLSYRDISSPVEWILLRLDDNNNETVMFRFIEKHCADSAQKIYEAKGHKQTYFVKRKENTCLS